MGKSDRSLKGHATRREFMRRAAATGVGAAALKFGLLGSAEAATAPAGPVNVLTWGGHVEKSEIEDFGKETGIRVNFIGGSGNSENMAKIKLGGGAQYDLVGVDALWVPKYYQEGIIEAFDMEAWPQYPDLLDEFKKMTVWKAGNLWLGQPWAWSPHLVWYNPNRVKTPTSIQFLWDPALKARIAFVRQQEDVMAWMGLATGAKKPYDMNKEELARAKEALKRLVPNVLKFPTETDELVKLMADESIWVTVLSAGGGVRIKEAGGVQPKVFMPPEGTIGYFDGDCIVKGASHRDAAIVWMQHRMQAKYLTQNFQRMRRPLAYKSPLDLLKSEGKGSLAHELFYDQPEIIGKMIIIGPPPNIGAYIDAYNEAVGG
jgi:spermidine/putrescine-binding protein